MSEYRDYLINDRTALNRAVKEAISNDSNDLTDSWSLEGIENDRPEMLLMLVEKELSYPLRWR